MTACTIVLISAAAAGQMPDNVLLDFSASWCGPCRQMAPLVNKLARQGLPIRKIDVDANPALTQRFRIKGIPAFVLIVNGKVVERTTGYTSERKLREMMSRIPRQIAKTRTTTPESPSQPAVPKTRASEPLTAKSGSQPAKRFQLPLAENNRKKNTVIRGNLDEAADAAIMEASVRIRVVDGDGINYGSGTVIDSRPGRSIILTCAHIFRDNTSEAAVNVDLFNGENTQTYKGTTLSYNLEADVGLIAIATSEPIPSILLAPADSSPKKGQDVQGIGCGGGKLPVKLPMRVTAVNRYLGPDNIECTVVPQQGRSGGGLFNEQGRLIGVCFAADPKSARGLYAGIRPIRQLLDKADIELSSEEDARFATVSTQDDSGESKQRPRSVRIDQRQLALMQVNFQGRKSSAERRTGGLESGPFPASRQTPRAQPKTTRAASPSTRSVGKSLGKTSGAEVICIVRSLDNPRSASQVVIINRASPKFMQYLRNEMQSQPHKTSRVVKNRGNLTPAHFSTPRRQVKHHPTSERLVSPFRQVTSESRQVVRKPTTSPSETGRYRRSARTRMR